MNTILRAILRGVVWRLLPRNKATLLILGIVALVFLVLANGAKAATTSGTCVNESVAANATFFCTLDLGAPSEKLTVLAEQPCAGAGTMAVNAYPLYAGATPQTREQALGAELTQNLACNGTSTIAQRRWVIGGVRYVKIGVQNADATNARVLKAEWFSQAAPTTQPLEIVNDDGGAITVECVQGCEGGAGGGEMTLSTDDRDRLDLSWWGIWLNGGLLLVLIAAPIWARAWRSWRDS